MSSPDSRPAPLDGVRILSFTQMLMGPAGVQYLSDLGADVIKVENPHGGAWERNWAGANAFVGGTSVFYLLANRNERSITLNLKDPRAIRIVRALLARTDVLVQNFRPGVTERLGLGYAQLKEEFPRLIYVSASGYGETGPYRDRPGQDLLVQALSGLTMMTGRSDDPPTPTGSAIVDQHAALLIAFAALTALRLRDQTGAGSCVEISLLLAALDLQSEPIGYYLNGFSMSRSASGLASAFHPAPYGIYKTLDGYLALSLTALEQLRDVEEFGSLTALGDVDALARRDDIRRMLEPVIAGKRTDYWVQSLTAQGIWCGPVNDYEGLFADPQVAAVQPTVAFDYPGIGTVRALGSPVRLSAYTPSVRRPPTLGEQTEDVLQEIGLSREEIAELRAGGVV